MAKPLNHGREAYVLSLQYIHATKELASRGSAPMIGLAKPREFGQAVAEIVRDRRAFLKGARS